MTVPDGVGALPAFVALDALAVLGGARRGASVQLDDTYFGGQLAAMEATDAQVPDERRETLGQSKALYDDVDVDVERVTEENLRSASVQYRDYLQAMPEVRFLVDAFPETAYVVPEWTRTRGAVNYGATVYFFRSEDPPTPSEVVGENVTAVVEDDRASFTRYQGAVHGYPECCIERYVGDQGRRDVAPEVRSVEPVAEHVDGDAIPEAPDSTTSIDDVVGDLFETPDAYAFLAREFFPEKGCETARRRGLDVYETLLESVPETLVQDFFRLNVGWSYLVARSVREGAAGRPAPGRLGREQLLSYLPLASVLSVPRYGAEA